MNSDQNPIIYASYLLVAVFLFLSAKTVVAADITPSASNSKVLAVVNGRNITVEDLKKYEQRRGVPKDANAETQRQMMLEELINRELIYADAISKGVDNRPAVQAEIENQRVNIVASAMLKNVSETATIGDDELKKAYNEMSKNMGSKEFKASHILLESEKNAQVVIAQLNKGADFSAVAKEKSTGPSGPNGGDLGWFKADQMVKPFSDAVMKLKDGEFTKTPVKTQFGWHVILRMESRELPPPSYDSVKEQLRMRLRNKSIEKYIGSLRSKAEIQRK